jgi:chemotaxis signal transduction protein
MNGMSDPSPPPAAAGTPPGMPAAAPAAPGPQAAPRLALFRLGGRLCGITAAFCKQFVQLEAVTRVPLAPAHLLGVTQLRGRILPVLDPSLLPGLPGLPAPPEPAAPPATPKAVPAASGMQALVVTASGLDSALAALRVSEIVGFERPTTASGPAGGAVPPAAPAVAAATVPPAVPPATPAVAADAVLPAVPAVAADAVPPDVPPTIPPHTTPTAARPLWRGEEVAVLDVAVLFASLRPGMPDAASGSRGAQP